MCAACRNCQWVVHAPARENRRTTMVRCRARREHFVLECSLGLDSRELIRPRLNKLRRNGQSACPVVRGKNLNRAAQVDGGARRSASRDLQIRWASLRLDVDSCQRIPGSSVASAKKLERVSQPLAIHCCTGRKMNRDQLRRSRDDHSRSQHHIGHLRRSCHSE